MTIPEFVDQFFVLSKQWILSYVPGSAQPLFSALLSIIPITVVFPTLFAITTVLERKGLARIQNRIGPNRVGPFGFLQPAADGIKSLIKEDIIPARADKVLFTLAPILLVIPALVSFMVVPVGRNMIVMDLDTGLLFFFAVGAGTEIAVFMAGWGSRNKYALLGALRAIAQMVSYELPLIMSALVVVMMTGSLSTMRIVEMQGGYFAGLLPNWNVFAPQGAMAFVLFMVAASAEANRTPFDLPEGESEIVAGYFVEYSGFKFALFFLGEYLGLFAASSIAVTLFLGGWQAPFPFLGWVPSYAWFFLKLLVLICFFIWVRGTLPRLRADQLMNLAWKFMIPMALLTLVVSGIWPLLPQARWRGPAIFLVLFAGAWGLSRGFFGPGGTRVRQYRFAE